MASLKELMKEADDLGIDYTELTKDELVEAIAETKPKPKGGKKKGDSHWKESEETEKEEEKVTKPKAKKKVAKKTPVKAKAGKKVTAKEAAPAKATKAKKASAPIPQGENPFREGSEAHKIAAWIMKLKDPEKVIEKIAEDDTIGLGNRTKQADRLAYARVRFYDVRYYLQVKLAEKE